MRITIAIDADYTTSFEVETRLTFDTEPDGRDDTVTNVNIEGQVIVSTMLALINSLDEISEMEPLIPGHHREYVPEYGAVLTTRITTKRPQHGLHLN